LRAVARVGNVAFVDPDEAHRLACTIHLGGLDRHGRPLIDHVERVAAAVPPDAEVVAYLHDAVEHSGHSMADLEARGLTAAEASALGLLTQLPGESYEAYVLRVAYARGPGADLARTVKLADLDDHLSRPRVPGDPPYGWARRHVEVCRDRYDRSPHAA
jgi:hypothetical protein